MGCVNVEILSDNADPIKVQENLKIFIQKKYDGVMAAQVVAAAAPGAVRTMKDAKIPMVATFVVHPGVPFVDVNNGAAGAMAGAGLMKEALRKWGAAVEPYLLIGSLKEGGLNSIQRMDGYYVGVNQVQPNFPSSRFIDVPTQGADPAKTNVNTGNALQTIPKDAKIILGGINDDNTVAMVQAYKASGRDMNNLLAVGQGASLLSNICSGELYGSVAYFPENYGKYLIPAVIGLIKKVPNHVVLPTTLLTAKNVGKYYPKSACS
jgi:ribose transport system substrate-binding protein